MCSASLVGVDATLVHIEVDVSFGLPTFTIIGLPDATVRESRDRVRTAIKNSGYEFPPHRITVNLAPADVPKTGSSFDLPVALGILAVNGPLHQRAFPDTMLLGELSLDGTINPVRGVLPSALAARRAGIARVVLPPQNANEATLVDGLDVRTARNLVEAVAALNEPDTACRPSPSPALSRSETTIADLRDVKGQALARRALEVAAAGAHNILLVGPPGTGKTMLARRLPGILPPLNSEEALQTMAIHSVAGTLPPGHGILEERPFRAPHHTASSAALVGGGTGPRPGEVSLAHNGVLFLDEMPEFPRRVLELLRQPLEDGYVTVARAARTITFPARFVLVGAMNPCPCGYAGDPHRRCRCSPQEIAAYRQRLSGPLRDRIDLMVDVAALPFVDMLSSEPGESTGTVRARVLAAHVRAQSRIERCRSRDSVRLGPAALPPSGRRLLATAVDRFGLSARAVERTLRVARTIATLAGADDVGDPHLAEALQYRVR